MTIAQARPQPPGWLVEYATSFSDAESHAFILHGDIEGLAMQAIGQRDLLLAHLAETRAIVASFDLARGITIARADQPVPGKPGQTRRERALAIAGLAAPQGGTGSLAGLLGGIGPGGGGDDPFGGATSPGAAFPILQKLLLGGGQAEVAVVIDYADQVVPAAGPGGLAPPDRAALVSLLAWARDSRIEQDQQVLFLLCRELVDLHPALRAADAGWRPVAMPLPDGAARAAWLDWYLAYRAASDRPIALNDGLTVREVATLSAGLSLRNLEDVLLTSAAAGGLTRLGLQAVKDRIIATSYADVAAMLDPLEGGLDTLGGLAPVKAWLRERLIAPLRDGRTQDVPKGVMFVGPPGTGKTLLARALARETGFGAIAVKMDRLLDKYVGGSERNMARLFGFARALAPCIMFIDEVDQSDVGKRGGDSGNPVASNLFSSLIQFAGDPANRGRVILLFATNRPDLLDPALIRDERVDAVIPILLPERDDRRLIAAAQAAMQGCVIADGGLDLIADRTERYSAAAIGSVVREARLLARGEPIGAAFIAAALDDLRPTGTGPEADLFTLQAVKAVNKRSLLPPRYRDLLVKRETIDQAIADARSALPDSPRTARQGPDLRW